jgi:hypothetical protein
VTEVVAGARAVDPVAGAAREEGVTTAAPPPGSTVPPGVRGGVPPSSDSLTARGGSGGDRTPLSARACADGAPEGSGWAAWDWGAEGAGPTLGGTGDDTTMGGGMAGPSTPGRGDPPPGLGDTLVGGAAVSLVLRLAAVAAGGDSKEGGGCDGARGVDVGTDVAAAVAAVLVAPLAVSAELLSAVSLLPSSPPSSGGPENHTSREHSKPTPAAPSPREKSVSMQRDRWVTMPPGVAGEWLELGLASVSTSGGTSIARAATERPPMALTTSTRSCTWQEQSKG